MHMNFIGPSCYICIAFMITNTILLLLFINLVLYFNLHLHKAQSRDIVCFNSLKTSL